MKNIVFCADGTWDGTSNGTNVFKLFNSLNVTSTQLPFYDSGVGVSNQPIERILGGAMGAGLFQKIKDGYTKLAHAYAEGDKLFLFGFSRGAFTARSIAGMINVCGLPTGVFDETLVEGAFNAYRERDPEKRRQLLDTLKSYKLIVPPIEMIGVWDTVGALGIPAIVGGVDPNIYGFLNTDLHPNVQRAYHALAIDERRREFPPTLWTLPEGSKQILEQVWFVGAHSDVGGGYAPDAADGTTTLSDVTLGWMLGKARAAGLDISDAVYNQLVPIHPKLALDHIHESWNPLWLFFKRRTIPPNSYLSDTVEMRYLNDHTYRPANLAYQEGKWNPECQKVAIMGLLEELEYKM